MFDIESKNKEKNNKREGIWLKMKLKNILFY